MLGHLKKVPTINFGPIRPLHAALKIGKVTENPKNNKIADPVLEPELEWQKKLENRIPRDEKP